MLEKHHRKGPVAIIDPQGSFLSSLPPLPRKSGTGGLHMTVLSNLEIVQAIKDGKITIDPEPQPGPGDPGTQYDTCSVNLHLDDQLLVPPTPQPKLTQVWDLSDESGSLRDTLERIGTPWNLATQGPYTLDPGEFVLGQTHEKLRFDGNDEEKLCGRVEGRSSFARTGLVVHCTAPTLHADYKGTVTLELKNLGTLPLRLRPGLLICQIVVETIRGDFAKKPKPQFDDQTRPSGGR
jgi:dCTP deaminase